MNKNLSKRYQALSPDYNLDKIDVKKRKNEEEHQNLSCCGNNKYYVRLCKMNAAKSFYIETLPTSNVLMN